jgi:hypothetical protein
MKIEDVRLIDEDGVLTFPLYHGTSSLFLPSIMKHGLGGRNIIEECNVLEFARELLEKIKTSRGHTLSALSVDIFEKMCNQEITDGGFNFTHGGVYLSISVGKAAQYASSNKHGSELISYVMKAYENLNLQSDTAINRKYGDLLQFLDKGKDSAFKILIEVNGINIESLRKETMRNARDFLEGREKDLHKYIAEKIEEKKVIVEAGQGISVEEYIEKHKGGMDSFIRKHAEYYIKDIMYGNFELLKPINKENLIIYKINNFKSEIEFDLEPLKI